VIFQKKKTNKKFKKDDKIEILEGIDEKIQRAVLKS